MNLAHKFMTNEHSIEKVTEQASKAPIFRGRVVSDVSDKTIVVEVDTLKIHPKYRKQYRSTKRYKVHDPENRYSVGEEVSFKECSPISKEKRHQVITV